MTKQQMTKRLQACRDAARKLRATSNESRSLVLEKAAEFLVSRSSEIIKANQKDLKALKDATSAFRDRLLLNEKRLAQAAEGLRQIAANSDPLNESLDQKTLKNGLKVKRVRSPLGVIFLIFESRPNVALEAFGLAVKSANVAILRGGKESSHTTKAIYHLLSDSLKAAGLEKDMFWGISDPDRAIVNFLLEQKAYIDVVIPRGGEGLINFVVANSKIPIIKNDRGMCHVYIHDDADSEMAVHIVENAKTHRPGVCNAMETVLVHEGRAKELLPLLYARLEKHQVEWHGCPKTVAILKGKAKVKKAGKKDFDTEYLDLIMNCKVVKSYDEAVTHIETHGSRHSESIITKAESKARDFQNEVDAAAVYWNASTRFTDGFELGLGGEMGISTQKLHVRGPVGLKELTSLRWVIDGSGQTRS